LHDLFLSYNRVDIDSVRDVRALLEARGVHTFIDWQDLDAGRVWPDALERALESSRAVAIFLGRSGLGRVQKIEAAYALDLYTRAGVLVIPILLRGADPPGGFLSLNTWVDLRDGISDASIGGLIRALEGIAEAPPPSNVCPYRDLRSFREEDGALFFGRDEAIEAIVAKVDRADFAAIVGPSGSGKSSVAVAGVLPRLRRRRPPAPVWDGVTFTPGMHPWRSLADALVPLLEPDLSGVERIAKGGMLSDALQAENGIASTVAHLLAESRGTNRLLVIIDQFEELFTLTEPDVARAFLRALFAASRSAPMTLLVTLRSDYYGKAIALDRDLSNILPAAQVNLGPMRRDELREIIVRPAAIAGLSFEPRLVDRILDDVGQEPGYLPLLEYALSELWELRTDRTLTLSAYEQIGGVSGALAKRANALYDPLSAAEKSAARRLMTRLVRVSEADEEGADTRRRARRDEIDDDAWKLVDPFVKARLLVVSENDVVEVAHEALIRKWDRLRAWLNEDRKFLLWRQQLAVVREAWPEALPPGPILDEAQKWRRERRGELSTAEREYVERSARKRTRARVVLQFAAAAVVLALAVAIAQYFHQRTPKYNADRILDAQLEKRLLDNDFPGPQYDSDVENLALLIRLGREKQMLRSISLPFQLTKLAVAMRTVDRQRGREILEHAEKNAGAVADYARFSRAWVVFGEPERAVAALKACDGKFKFSDLRERHAEAWLLAGNRERARQTLFAASDGAIDPDFVDTLIRVNDPADRQRIAEAVDAVVASLKMSNSEREVRFLFIVQAFLDIGNLEEAKRLLPASVSSLTRDEVVKMIALAEMRIHGRLPDAAVLRQIEDRNVRDSLIDDVMSRLVRARRDADAAVLIAIAPEPHSARASFVKHLVDARRFEEAIKQAELIFPLSLEMHCLSQARSACALARLGRRDAAEAKIAETLTSSQHLVESARDEVRSIIAPTLALLGRYRDARLMADSIESDEYQMQGYFAILRIYEETQRRSRPGDQARSGGRAQAGPPSVEACLWPSRVSDGAISPAPADRRL
jgi:hypothetical protein